MTIILSVCGYFLSQRQFERCSDWKGCEGTAPLGAGDTAHLGSVGAAPSFSSAGAHLTARMRHICSSHVDRVS
jgi:hypothetical protein